MECYFLACNFTKSKTPPCVFSHFSIVQSVPNYAKRSYDNGLKEASEFIP